VDAHRELYNAALQERRDAWSQAKTRINYGDQSAQLTEIRSVRPDQAVWSFSSQQATLRRLNKAFAGFFRRVKAGQKAGYPRFKGAARFDSVEWPKDGDGARWLPVSTRVYLQGIGQVKVHLHRQVAGRVKTIQVKRHGRRWMLVLSCDDVPTNPLPATGQRAGVDVGIVSFATTSDGQHVDIPAGAGRLPSGWPARSSGWPAPNPDRTTVTVNVRRWPRSIAKLPISARTSTTNKPVRWSHAMTYWWWRTYSSSICYGWPNPSRIPTSPGRFSQTVPGQSRGFHGVSVTPAGGGSSLFCAPKRKTLGVHGLRSTPATPPMAARTVGMQPPKTASPKRTSSASDALIAPKQTNTPHAISSGLDWPFTRKPREKKPAASSRRRSHELVRS
jgi:hypothetical protein